MIDLVNMIVGAWPYWVPGLSFFIGLSICRASHQDKSREQLCRLTGRIDIPDEWRDGVVYTALDGRPLDKPEMSNAGLLIRSFDGHGSGVCISSDGIVLTNAHVVGEETVVEVEDGPGSCLGRVIKRCDKRDVALIRISGTPSIVAEVADELPAVGDDLYVSGAPWAVENKSILTRGVVSKHAKLEGLPYIYTDASIAPGNSGGPVFNSLGKLVGITVAMQLTPNKESSHIGLVIPIGEAMESMKVESKTTAAMESAVSAESAVPVSVS